MSVNTRSKKKNSSDKRELGTTKDVRHYVNFVIEKDIPKAISKEEIIVSMGNDRELQRLIKCRSEEYGS